jgi:hypothetical protein
MRIRRPATPATRRSTIVRRDRRRDHRSRQHDRRDDQERRRRLPRKGNLALKGKGIVIDASLLDNYGVAPLTTLPAGICG